MITRRALLVRTFSAAGLMAIPVWAAKGEFWNEKPLASWSSAEIERLLSRSPWAKDVEVEFDMEGGDGPPGGGPPGGFGGGPGGGPPGGGFPPGGGPPPPGGGFPGGGQEGMKTTVRWESAKPIREVRKKLSPEDFEKYYVIGLFGGPLTMMRTDPGRGQERRERTDRRPPDAGEMKANLEKNTQLQIRGKETLHPERIVEVEDGIMILFSRDDHPIKLENRDITFQTKLGPLRLKAKFALKDMVYRNQLEL